MKMLKFLTAGFAVASAIQAAAVAEIGDIQVNTADDFVTVTYTLTEDAVVTARFFAGGDWIDPKYVTLISGDLNKKVSATGSGEKRSIVWQARREDLPEAMRATYRDARVELTAWAIKAPPPYMVVDLGEYGQPLTDVPHYYASKEEVPGGITHADYKTKKLLLYKVPARQQVWWMGCKSKIVDDEYRDNERYHRVVFSDDYYLGVYPVTQSQAKRLYNERCRDNKFWGDRTHTPGEDDFRPTCGNGYDIYRGSTSTPDSAPTADSRLGRMRTRFGIDFDLPTEAQWEYACRAGVENSYAYGGYRDNETNAWTAANSNYGDGDGQLTRPVDKWAPNAWGFYDMPGNVNEICRDLLTEYSFTGGVPVLDPLGTNAEGKPVVRGGAYNQPVTSTRSPCRGAYPRNTTEWGVGVRLSCPAVAR